MNLPAGSLRGVRIDPSLIPARPTAERLDGWKLIAAHFGRDRTTVIRWARERGMPVHRMPGGRTGTVYALRCELDRWAGVGVDAPEASPPSRSETDVPSKPAPGQRSRRLRLAAFLMLAVALAGGAFLNRPSPSAPPVTAALPANPEIASRFLAARDLAAERSAAGLEQAIAMLEDVTRSAASFAQGHAALGEALLLSREFGQRTDSEAFFRARQAARSTVRLDPRNSDGYRLLGFIAYWADGDFTEATDKFRQALRLNPNDAMAYFWYGNILSDHGDHKAALRHLDRARLLQPGSVAIQTDLAWARWAAGQDTAAVAALRDIIRRRPDFSVAHDCLSIIALFEGDHEGYVRHFASYARERANPRLMARAREAERALRSDGAPAMRRLILRHAIEDVNHDGKSGEWAAAIASMDGNRGDVLRLLDQAARRGERWGQSGLLRRVEGIWRNDPEIRRRLALMHHVTGPI